TGKKVPIVGKVISGIERAEKAAGTSPASQESASAPLSSPAYITQVFQPAQCVVPPGSEKWVVEKNSAYMDSLAPLGHSMQQIARGGDSPDPTIHQAADQNYQKALDAVRDIAKGFQPVGVEGLDQTVQHLLEEPIFLTKSYIIVDMDKAAAGKASA